MSCLYEKCRYAVAKRKITYNESEMAASFRDIYIGHSPATNWGSDKPLTVRNIPNLDTGAGHSGRLIIIDIESKRILPI